VLVSAGQRHESCFFEPLLERLLAEGRTPIHLLGDKDTALRASAAGSPNAPSRPSFRTAPTSINCILNCPARLPTLRRRNVVERTIGFLKQCRSVATRFDKLPKCFLAMIKLAFIRLYLRKSIRQTLPKAPTVMCHLPQPRAFSR